MEHSRVAGPMACHPFPYQYKSEILPLFYKVSHLSHPGSRTSFTTGQVCAKMTPTETGT